MGLEACYRIYTENKNLPGIENALKFFFTSATIYTGKGFFEGESEPCAIIEIIGKEGYEKTFGDYRICECDHPYYRHFDTYDNMRVVGCKYCECSDFEETGTGKTSNLYGEVVRFADAIRKMNDQQMVLVTKSEVEVSEITKYYPGISEKAENTVKGWLVHPGDSEA